MDKVQVSRSVARLKEAATLSGKWTPRTGAGPSVADGGGPSAVSGGPPGGSTLRAAPGRRVGDGQGAYRPGGWYPWRWSAPCPQPTENRSERRTKSRQVRSVARNFRRGDQIDVKPLHPSIGAEITGVDLAVPMDDDTAAALRSALWKYKVIAVQDESPTPDALIGSLRPSGRWSRFSSATTTWRPSEIYVLSNVRRDGRPIGRWGRHPLA